MIKSTNTRIVNIYFLLDEIDEFARDTKNNDGI